MRVKTDASKWHEAGKMQSEARRANAPEEVILLPKPADFPAKAVFESFASRRTIREFSPEPLPLQLIAANVYLFAAAAGLAAWFHNCDQDGLHIALRLAGDQHVLFGQTVGYPAP